ncbi:MAG: class I SAM-dependent methyltransferase, partial [Candidatus Aminicenantes bacterium]|nr:class I SAM-dependent methyltransferase [Candidatus Aminicenantes bacterium]
MDQDKEFVPCNLCGSTRSRIYLRKLGLTIVKCLRCGLVYVSPRLTEKHLLDRYDKRYFEQEYLPALGAGPASYSLQAAVDRFELFLEMLKMSALPGRNILDVGAGGGFFVMAARHIGFEAEGVEVSDDAAAYGRDVLGVPIRTGAFSRVEYRPESFDAVVMLDTIEHLQDPLADLRKARDVLNPGGRLILHTPDLRSLSRPVLGRNWAVFSPLEHLYYFNRRTLAALLRRAGFRVIGVRNFSRFNLDNTHAPDSRRGRAWKKRLARWSDSPFWKKMETYERKELIRLIEKSNEGRRPILSDDPPLDIQVSAAIR